jgi:hypothetical protein
MTVAKAGPEKGKREHEPLLIDMGFQLREIFPLLFFVVVYALLLGGALFLPLQEKIAEEPDMGVRVILQSNMNEIHLRLWPLLLVAGLAAVYFRIYRSLRVLKPVYRLHHTLGEIAAGEHPAFRVLPREEFRFLEEDIAQLNQKMKLLSSRNRDILLNIHTQVRKMNERVASGEIVPRADLEEFLAGVRAQLEKAPELGARH